MPPPPPLFRPIPEPSLRRRGEAAVFLPDVVPTGWHRSMPGEQRREPVKPSDVFPVYTLPENWATFLVPEVLAMLAHSTDKPDKMAFVRLLAYSGAYWRYSFTACQVLRGSAIPQVAARQDLPEPIAARLEHELAIVTEVGYADYFLIVWDICCYATRQGIPFLARGSAADSLLCYVLGISTVCPIRFQLYFERFLNPERMKFSKLADIDLDFPWDQRDEVMNYVFERWGRDHVAMIGGFSRYQARGAVADIGKAFGLSEAEVRSFTKLLPWVSADRIADALSENVRLKEIPTHEEPYPEIIEMAKHLTDLPRHAMMHPCGIVISREKLCRITPLMPSGRGPQMTQYDMDAIEDLGLVKIDLLGQAGLSVLRDVLQRVKQRHNLAVELDRLSWEDERTWDMIANGGARGIHHIESPAMTSLLVQSNCRDMDCLCAIVSVIRPGAADESKKLLFTRRHQGFAPTEYPHASLEPYLRDTYGLLVFEEHILMVAHHFAGMNLGRSDVLRRELVKMKNPEKLIELGLEFRECARALGRTDTETEQVWRTLVAFHGYMFNKAHSASYAVEAYQGAWLKARFPAIYMAAILSNERGFYTALFYSLEARRLGLKLLLPDVNAPSADYEADASETAIRLPLRAIKGLTEATWRQWWQQRQRRPFTSLEDFARRVAPHESELPLLVDCGAFDSLAPELSRPQIFWELHELRRAGAFGLEGLFADLPVQTARQRGLQLSVQPPDALAMAKREWELLGFPVTLDATTLLGHGLSLKPGPAIATLQGFHGKTVQFNGLVVQTRRNHTLKGEVMQFFTLADATGYIECTAFPAVYQKCGHYVRQHQLVRVKGKVEPFDNRLGQTLNILAVELLLAVD
jgi:DNA-directed DNA polymerase III PolC